MKKRSLLCNLALTFCFFSSLDASPEYTLIEDRTTLPIYTPSISQRETQRIRLKNGLEAYLISDPEARLSGAMLSVKTGSWEDPDEHPGLAHFLEHMLFLGTKQYPGESEYGKHITQNGGQANAFTTDSSTSYLFTIDNAAFPQALDRFSSFFKEPLFNPSGVARELQAIDQEYAKNLEQDEIRMLYVMRELANTDHPLHGFNMGNSEALAGVSRATLENWYQQHYSANLMRLLVYSPLPIEEIREQVVEKFAEVPTNNREPFSVTEPAFSSDILGKYIYIEPIKDSRSLTLIWELPPKFASMIETKPEKIVTHVLGHEGEKSLLAQLKQENLAEAITCNGTKLGDDLFVLYLDIDLTDKGLGDVEEVITRCFQAIANLRDSGVPRYLFDEIQQMATIKYQHPAKENEFGMLMKHAFKIHDEDLATYPELTKVPKRFDQEAVVELLEYLTPHNALFFIVAPGKLTRIKADKKEAWLGVDYTVRNISKDTLDSWKHSTPVENVALPQPNIFIPQDLQLLSQSPATNTEIIPQPKVLVETPGFQLYFAQDTRYGIPKVAWFIRIRTPQIALNDPAKVVLGDLYVKCLEDALNRYAYPAKIAGLEYNITRARDGVEIEVEGYSQNAPLLLAEILKAIDSLTPTMEQFKTFKASLRREYLNFAKESPYKQGVELLKSVLYEDFVTAREKATAIQKISFKLFSEYATHIFDKTSVAGVFYGNMSEGQGRELTSQLQTAFNHGVYPTEEQARPAVIVLPPDQGPYFLESRTQSQGNATILAIENHDFSFRERAAQQILMQAIQQPFFTELRTKQQTGYLVSSFGEELERKLFNIFAVQSNTHDPRDLLSRFEAFLEHYLQEIGKTELSEEQFNTIKQTLLQKLETPAQNVEGMGELLKTLAFDYDGDFKWIEKRKEGLKTLGYSEFLAIAHNFLGKGNKQRLGILLQGENSGEKTFSYSRARSWNSLRNISDYQHRKSAG